MIPKTFSEIIDLGDGRKITIETGKLAKQADGSAVIRMGNAMLLATVVSSKSPNPVDFLPLTVDYREKFAAAGRFPGGFFKREARPSNEEILTMRLVDRVLRPMFPKDYHCETQVMIQLMSHDEEVMPDALAGLAASTVIQLSDIPFEAPISEVRVGRINGNLIINPSKSQLLEADIDLVVGASEDFVAMVEGQMDEVSEEEMAEAIAFAHEAIKEQCAAQLRLVEKLGGKKPTRSYESALEDEDLKQFISNLAYTKCYEIASQASGKHERSAAFESLFEDIKGQFSEEEWESKAALVGKYYSQFQKKAVRDLILTEGKRLDGRKTKDIRPIWCEVNYLPSTHGSAIFTRGETQVLSTVTLGTSREANIIDIPTEQGEEKFYLHYNFPPFSTGEARMLRGTSRREIGHGNLAQRALSRMIPSDWPYTIRVVAEVLESNGSSSMATVCASTMALMDGGVRLKSPVSGIAMGLILDAESGKYAVLSDILGDEDHLGDMDFKVTGTEKGITACQMDIKIKGLSHKILVQALEQAREGRLHILDKMTETISQSAEQVKPHAPKMVMMTIPAEFIGAVIGSGGKVIQEMQKETGTTIVIEEKEGKGLIEILGVEQEMIDKVIQRIQDITFVPVEGETYKVKVSRLLDFGAIVEFRPGIDTLLHISELAWERVEKVEDLLQVGDELEVKYLGIDPKSHKTRVSRKALLPKPEGYQPPKPREDGDRRSGSRGPRNDRSGHRDNRGRRDNS